MISVTRATLGASDILDDLLTKFFFTKESLYENSCKMSTRKTRMTVSSVVMEGSGFGVSLLLPRVSEGVLLIGEATGHRQ